MDALNIIVFRKRCSSMQLLKTKNGEATLAASPFRLLLNQIVFDVFDTFDSAGNRGGFRNIFFLLNEAT